MSIIVTRTNCAICQSKNLTEVLDLGLVPLAGYFPEIDQSMRPELYPLRLLICEKCKLAQVDNIINPDHLFLDYRYSSSDSLSNHFLNYAKLLDSRYSVQGKKILEIGSNDGVLLEPLAKLGGCVVGVEPSHNIGKKAKDKGLDIINDFFAEEQFPFLQVCPSLLALANRLIARSVLRAGRFRPKVWLRHGGDLLCR